MTTLEAIARETVLRWRGKLSDPETFEYLYENILAALETAVKEQENNAGKLAEALRGMMQAFAWNADKTVAEQGEDALQSDVKRAREALARWEGK